jgi:hypothetical protein
VVALPQPSSLAGNRFQGVEVRVINSNAATQLWSGTWRETPPRGAAVGAAVTHTDLRKRDQSHNL